MFIRIWKAIRRTFSNRYYMLITLRDDLNAELHVKTLEYSELPDKRVQNGPSLRREIESIKTDLSDIEQDLKAYV